MNCTDGDTLANYLDDDDDGDGFSSDSEDADDDSDELTYDPRDSEPFADSVPDFLQPLPPVIASPANNELFTNADYLFTGKSSTDGNLISSIKLTLDGSSTFDTTSAKNGDWDWSYPGTIPTSMIGVHTISARAQIGQGISAPSSDVTFAFLPAPVITAPADGTVSTNRAPTITGTSGPNIKIEVMQNGTVLDTVESDSNGKWEVTIGTALLDGVHVFAAVANVDQFQSASSNTVSYTVLDVPVITSPSDKDLTPNRNIPISGTSGGNATIRVEVNGSTLGTTTADANGRWSLTPPTPFADGKYSARAFASVGANIAGPSNIVAFTVLNAPVITSPKNGTSSKNRRPTITGSGANGTTVNVRVNGQVAGSVPVSSGAWSFSFANDLVDGLYQFSAVAVLDAMASGSSNVVNYSVTSQAVQNETYSISGTVRLVNLEGTPLAGVTVTNGAVSAVTDANGRYELAGLQSSAYNLTGSIADFKVELDNRSNPIVVAQNNLTEVDFLATPKVEQPVYLFWNGFLKMTNIIEVINTGDQLLATDIKLFENDGRTGRVVRRHERSVVVPANSQHDVIVNDITGFNVDTYGILKLSFGTDDFAGRLIYYRPSGNGDYDYVLPLPLANSVRGNSYATFNTFQLSSAPGEESNLIAQWVSIANVDDEEKYFTINRYNADGKFITSQRVAIPPMGRFDLEGGHEVPGMSNVGLNEIVPDDKKSPYVPMLFRYSYTGLESFNFALSLKMKPGNNRPQVIPLSNTAGAANYVEVANVSSQTATANLVFYDESGKKLRTMNLIIPPKGQKHVAAHDILPENSVGSVMVSADVTDSLVAQGMTYFRNQKTGGVLNAYANEAIESFGNRLTGSYNLFLNVSNWLRLINVSNESVDVTVRVKRTDGNENVRKVTLPPHGRQDLGLHDTESFGTAKDTYGVVVLEPSKPAAIVSELLRLRLDANQLIDFAGTTPIE